MNWYSPYGNQPTPQIIQRFVGLKLFCVPRARVESLAVCNYLIAIVYLCRTPMPPLDSCVERLWLITDERPHAKERIAASGTINLGINLRENEFRIYEAEKPERHKRLSGAVVSGTRSEPVAIDTRELVSVIGVRFKPGGAFPFLGAPASELADAHVDLETLWGSSAKELRERLCAAKLPTERFDLLENALMAHLFRPLERHNAVRLGLDTFSRADSELTIRDVVRETGLSQRHFIQLFAREVGMSPKLFCRVRRFRRTLETVRHTAAPDWGRVAVDCGYYDQSHLIHDFRFFSNLSPTEFVRLRSECVFQNHATLIR
ncbi:helix-turn-helix domain-containing protein [bacterium]|nr:helix-turn-helix domain-containing protein [bacterium]